MSLTVWYQDDVKVETGNTVVTVYENYTLVLEDAALEYYDNPHPDDIDHEELVARYTEDVMAIAPTQASANAATNVSILFLMKMWGTRQVTWV